MREIASIKYWSRKYVLPSKNHQQLAWLVVRKEISGDVGRLEGEIT